MLKLLIVKTSSLGDVIHNLPIIADIHAHHSDVKIDWLVEENFADIPRLHPEVNQVITIAMRRWRKALFNKKTWREIAAVKQQLTLQQYDIVLDTQGLFKSGLWAHFCNGIKHGYDKQSIREPIASLFYDIKHNVSYQQHAVARNRALAALTFAYPIPKSLPNYGIEAPSRQDSMTQNIINNVPYVIGLHGTSRDSKLWPTEHWIKLGQKLAELQLNLALPWVNQAELHRAEIIRDALQNVTVLPKLSIAQLSTVISHARAAIGVDTGLSHLSVALSIPTVAIYTDTNPLLTGVHAGAHAPAINLGNIKQIPSVEEVFEALLTLTQK